MAIDTGKEFHSHSQLCTRGNKPLQCCPIALEVYTSLPNVNMTVWCIDGFRAKKRLIENLS